jgi:recombination protein RecT
MSSPLPLRLYVEQKGVKDRLASILGQRAPQFAAAIVQVVNRNAALQNCTPESIMGAAITAAVLDLSIDPNLGEAYIIPYGASASFQLGYIGLTQLALRSGQYKRLGWQVVREGQLKFYDELTGELEIQKDGQTSDKVIGYASKFVLVNGFERGEYWTTAEVQAHAERFSQAYKRGKQDSPWSSDRDRMSLKTVLKRLLKIWGPKSIVMQKAFASDEQIFTDIDTSVDVETAKADEEKKVEDKKEAVKETVANVAGEGSDNVPFDDAPKTATSDQPTSQVHKDIAELMAIVEGIKFDDFKAFVRVTFGKDMDDVPGYADLSPTFCQELLTKHARQLGKFVKVYKRQ